MRLFLICALLFLLCFNASSSRAEEIEIKHADSLQADKQEITIKGNVIINYENAVVEAPEGKIETNSLGEHDKASFNGRAKLKLKDRKLEADKITIWVKDKVIYAEGNTISELKDKKSNLIKITSDYQELHWSGEDAKAKGNLKVIYQDTIVISDEAKILYKNKKAHQAEFLGYTKQAQLEQPTNSTFAKEFVFDLNTKNIWAIGNVNSKVWTDEKESKSKQDPVYLSAEELFIDNTTGTIIGRSKTSKVNLTYQETKGESTEATLLKEKSTGKPEKIIFTGNANVIQEDKQLSSEEVVFNFKDKKLTSNTKTKIRPKTKIFKKE